jgi:indolepyruvate ferredoxin oxidoreductase alpha subunit
MQKAILMGNEAIARGAYEAGCRVASGYPGTPSTEILETVAATAREIRSQWSPNEKVALEVAFGAAVAGARAMAVMKHVGLNVAADPLFTFSYSGINAGLVIVNADDPGPWSSQNEQDNRHYARAAKIPMLEPSDSQEAKDMTRLAFELSEQFDRPVVLRITTRIAHARGVVTLEPRQEIPLKPLVRDPKKYVMIPAHASPRHHFIEAQMKAIQAYAETADINRIEWGHKRRGIITDSVAYQYVKEACPDDSILKLGMVWPMPNAMIEAFARAVKALVVVEELDPFIETHVKAMGLAVTGKALFSMCGELTPALVDQALNGTVAWRGAEYPTPLPPRPPQLCKHCPHEYVFQILKDLDVTVVGDIGCYTLAALSPLQAMHIQTCMGASIGMHLGFEKARGRTLASKSVSVIGDSTFLHSGIAPLMDMVYNQGTGTVIILDNRTTAMTGHQENPGSGKTLMGDPTVAVDLAQIARALGVSRVRTLDPKNVDELRAAIEEELNASAPSVIVAQRKCLLKK